MTDPLRRLKFLPWRSLLQASVLTVFISAVLDFLITLGYIQSSVIRRAISLIYAPPLDLLITIVIAVGVGALAVYLLERLYQQVIVNTASLWALVLCLIVILFFKSLLLIPSLLVGFSQTQLLGIILGVFWKGRPYWR